MKIHVSRHMFFDGATARVFLGELRVDSATARLWIVVYTGEGADLVETLVCVDNACACVEGDSVVIHEV